MKAYAIRRCILKALREKTATENIQKTCFLFRLVEMQIKYIKKQIRIKAVLVKYMSEYFYIHLYANTGYFKSRLMA